MAGLAEASNPFFIERSPLHSGIEARKVNGTVRVLTVNVQLPDNLWVLVLSNLHDARTSWINRRVWSHQLRHRYWEVVA
jgi:hypothetical protein